MFLAIDIGNSNIVLGVFHNGEWTHVWRLETETEKNRDEYAVSFRNLFEQSGIHPTEITQSMIAGVVPALTKYLQDVLKELTEVESFILTPHTETGISLGTDNPEEIGPDLIAGAAGAYHHVGDTCIVVDFGTATTLIAVKKPGMLTGGAICAGLKITAEALVNKAALLDDIPLEPPQNILAKGTVEAMQSGLVLGHICMVEGLISRMKKELGPAKVVATGGLAEIVAPHTGCFDLVEPLLTLEGMRIIAKRQ